METGASVGGAPTISQVLDAVSAHDNLEVRKNFYDNPREIVFDTESLLVEYDPVHGEDRQSKSGFSAQCKCADGNTLTLNLRGFSNLTAAFGIQGTQAMRATPDYLNRTIKSIARSRQISNAYAVGDRNHVFTRDLPGLRTASELMSQYDRRKFSDTQSTSLTLERQPFSPTGHGSDPHFIDAIATIAVAFNGVQFVTSTEIQREICTNGMTKMIAISGKKKQYNNIWLQEAVAQTSQQAIEMKNSIDVMQTATLKDADRMLDYMSIAGLPTWIVATSKTLYDLAGKSDLTAAEQAKLCPFGIKTVWDMLNVMTYAMHRVRSLSSKQKLQNKLYNFVFRKAFVPDLQEAEACVV